MSRYASVLLCLAGCGGAVLPVAREPARPALPTSSTSDETATSTTLAPVWAPDAAASGAAGDLASCPLSPTVLELGAPGDGDPSAPVVVDGGFLVAFTRYDDEGASHLYVQRVSAAGELEEPVLLRSGVHASRPHVFSDGTHASVVAIAADGTAIVLPADPDAAASAPLSAPPEDVAFGPRGLVWTNVDGEHRFVHGEGRTDLSLPAPGSWPEPREQILASGPSLDAVLLIHGARRSLVRFDASGRVGATSFLFSGSSPTWAEASVAAGPDGFLVVRTGPGIGDLEVHLADALGTSEPTVTAIPPPASSSRPPDALVRRYPRAASLGTGWALSYWDGIGPSLVRIDAHGTVTGEPIEIRSGDERGGHTDARMTTTSDTIAMTWQVAPPRMGHGFPEEEPRRPGPRLAILRCAP